MLELAIIYPLIGIVVAIRYGCTGQGQRTMRQWAGLMTMFAAIWPLLAIFIWADAASEEAGDV